MQTSNTDNTGVVVNLPSSLKPEAYFLYLLLCTGKYRLFWICRVSLRRGTCYLVERDDTSTVPDDIACEVKHSTFQALKPFMTCIVSGINGRRERFEHWRI